MRRSHRLHPDVSTKVQLPELADIIVSDLHGVLPTCEFSLQSLIDARRRLLAPNGAMVPRVEKLWMAMVDSPEFI